MGLQEARNVKEPWIKESSRATSVEKGCRKKQMLTAKWAGKEKEAKSEARG